MELKTSLYVQVLIFLVIVISHCYSAVDEELYLNDDSEGSGGTEEEKNQTREEKNQTLVTPEHQFSSNTKTVYQTSYIPNVQDKDLNTDMAAQEEPHLTTRLTTYEVAVIDGMVDTDNTVFNAYEFDYKDFATTTDKKEVVYTILTQKRREQSLKETPSHAPLLDNIRTTLSNTKDTTTTARGIVSTETFATIGSIAVVVCVVLSLYISVCVTMNRLAMKRQQRKAKASSEDVEMAEKKKSKKKKEDKSGDDDDNDELEAQQTESQPAKEHAENETSPGIMDGKTNESGETDKTDSGEAKTEDVKDACGDTAESKENNDVETPEAGVTDSDNKGEINARNEIEAAVLDVKVPTAEDVSPPTEAIST